MIKNKQIKGLKNVELYFNMNGNVRYKLKICSICGQPIKSGAHRLILTESKIKKGRYSYLNRTTSKAVLWFHFRCRRKLFKLLGEDALEWKWELKY